MHTLEYRRGCLKISVSRASFGALHGVEKVSIFGLLLIHKYNEILHDYVFEFWDVVLHHFLDTF